MKSVYCKYRIKEITYKSGFKEYVIQSRYTIYGFIKSFKSEKNFLVTLYYIVMQYIFFIYIA